ncbi:hypothetical protein GSI_11439 [Ganoderma sinense ZZ0214-1]|uniref:Uncharacterized protein n=1 Tax=Ganoderma sinense ZZ0214-1 TaxID=1077348 RepID=A0A2G8RW03_9APHY|nr:hypothetical protein GSI_11439 [Ganoderma sinense ZZ0214-1]
MPTSQAWRMPVQPPGTKCTRMDGWKRRRKVSEQRNGFPSGPVLSKISGAIRRIVATTTPRTVTKDSQPDNQRSHRGHAACAHPLPYGALRRTNEDENANGQSTPRQMNVTNTGRPPSRAGSPRPRRPVCFVRGTRLVCTARRSSSSHETVWMRRGALQVVPGSCGEVEGEEEGCQERMEAGLNSTQVAPGATTRESPRKMMSRGRTSARSLPRI